MNEDESTTCYTQCQYEWHLVNIRKIPLIILTQV